MSLLALVFLAAASHAGPLEDLGDRARGLTHSLSVFKHRPRPAPEAFQPLASDSRESWLAAQAGLICPCSVRRKALGNAGHGTTLLSLRGASGAVRLVLKEYPFLSRLKWEAAPIQHRPVRPVTHAHEQFLNEIVMTRAFHDAGLQTVEILAAEPGGPWLATRFVEGEGLAAFIRRAYDRDPAGLEAVRRFGKALALAHAKGMVVGDPTVDNIMIRNAEPVFIDLDQAAFGGSASWDLVYFLFDALNHVPPPEGDFARSRGWLTFVETFLAAYRDAGGRVDPHAMFSLRNLGPEVFVTRPDRFLGVLEHLRRAAGRVEAR